MQISKTIRILFICLGVFSSCLSIAQNGVNWRTDGNSVSTTDFIGSTNSAALFFRTANEQRMSVSANGILQVNSLAGTGVGFVMLDAFGNFSRTNFSGNTNEVLTGNGTFQNFSALSGWNFAGNNLVNSNSGNVGIGINNPLYKLDVNGDARLSGKTHIYRIVPMPGDSMIRFGDSTIEIYSSVNRIEVSPSGGYGGLGIGFDRDTRAYGLQSLALGYRTATQESANNSIAMGSGAQNTFDILNNTIPNSLMVAFNSDIPTFFVGGANGAGTIGRVGIGTSNPQSDFQVGENVFKISMGAAPGIPNTYSISYIGFNVSRTAADQWATSTDGASNGGFVLISDIGGGLRFVGLKSSGNVNAVYDDAGIASNTRMFIRNDGRVIIGQEEIRGNSIYNDAFTRLTVNGRIMCKDLVVSTAADWPDFVFDSAYALMPMDSLGAYITCYKHLPGTPAASVQEENGISLYETCRKQQLQIEELTLYILQLNERLKALEAAK